MNDMPTKLDKTDARQGRSGVGVRYVLIGGLVLVILAFGLIYLTIR